MKIINVNTIPAAIVFLATLLVGVAASSASHSIEYSAFIGLNVVHTGDNSYMDYTQEATNTGVLQDGMWITEFKEERMNEGGMMNNKLVGLRMKFDDYALSAVTYRNSFYCDHRRDRSYGLGFSRVWQPSNNVTLDGGAMLLTGYRTGLIQGSSSASLETTLVVAPMISFEYRMTKLLSITHTIQGIDVHITALKFNF